MSSPKSEATAQVFDHGAEDASYNWQKDCHRSTKGKIFEGIEFREAAIKPTDQANDSENNPRRFRDRKSCGHKGPKPADESSHLAVVSNAATVRNGVVSRMTVFVPHPS